MLYKSRDKEKRQIWICDNMGKKILDSAMEIINQEGYENLTIRKVAKLSGCSNSAIYQRFGDKSALGKAIAEIQAKPFLTLVDENYSRNEDFLTNICKISEKMLEKCFAFGLEDISMQVNYHGGLKPSENPFVIRLEKLLNTAKAHGEIKVSDARETAFLMLAFFWGFVQMVRINPNYNLDSAKELLKALNNIVYKGISTVQGEELLWDMLREKGVSVDKALVRMKGDREAYKSFLTEFFADPDFECLDREIEAENAKNAFEYAHGLKGMAANLGLDTVCSKLSVLVEIFRMNEMEGAREAFEELMEACSAITVLL